MPSHRSPGSFSELQPAVYDDHLSPTAQDSRPATDTRPRTAARHAKQPKPNTTPNSNKAVAAAILGSVATAVLVSAAYLTVSGGFTQTTSTIPTVDNPTPHSSTPAPPSTSTPEDLPAPQRESAPPPLQTPNIPDASEPAEEPVWPQNPQPVPEAPLPAS